MEYVILNGDLIERSEAKVDIEDRGYQFGDGVYEVIRVYNGKMFTADEHLERLLDSGKKIELNIPYSKDQLKQMLLEMIAKNQLDLGIVYMQFSRGLLQEIMLILVQMLHQCLPPIPVKPQDRLNQ